MSDRKQGGLDAPIIAKDNRYPINFQMTTQDGLAIVRTWYFNPAHDKTIKAIRKMFGLKDDIEGDVSESTDESMDDVIADMDVLRDAVNTILRDDEAFSFITEFDDIEYSNLFAVIGKVGEGFKDSEAKRKKAMAKKKSAAEAKAKAGAAAFVAGRK